MNPSARMFQCARCHCQVIVCRHCDRGNVYCANGCADLARSASLRRAAKRYRSTRRGRHSNADRQRRFRARQREKVTHQGSRVVKILMQRPDGNISAAHPSVLYSQLIRQHDSLLAWQLEITVRCLCLDGYAPDENEPGTR